HQVGPRPVDRVIVRSRASAGGSAVRGATPQGRNSGADRQQIEGRGYRVRGIVRVPFSNLVPGTQVPGTRAFSMYSTCLFCTKTLGANESIETFPVGKRLAFDAAKGRLWVVCPHCERWNLSPLEERWEAIEQSEKLYRDTRRRVATDNI